MSYHYDMMPVEDEDDIFEEDDIFIDEDDALNDSFDIEIDEALVETHAAKIKGTKTQMVPTGLKLNPPQAKVKAPQAKDTIVHGATAITTATNKQQENLRLKVMIAVKSGYLGILQRIHKSLQTFSFSFRYPGGSVSKYTTPLLCSCKFNQEEVMTWLLPKVRKQKPTGRAKETPLILAVSNKKIKMEMIRTLLKDGEQNLGDKKKYKMTAVHIACKEGHVEVLELFLDYNNSWKAQGLRPPKILDTTDLGDKNGNTPFMLAVGRKTERHTATVRKWLEKDNDVPKTVSHDVNKRKFNAVMIAAHHGMLKHLKIMEEFKGITDVVAEKKTTSGWNVIHCAVASGDLETLEWLLTTRSGLLVNTAVLDAPNEKGYTPLLLACEYHHKRIVQYLVELPDKESGIQININAKTKKGMTALHLAAMHDAKDIVDFLLNYEIDVRAQEAKYGNTVLHIATSTSSMGVENRLKEEADEYEHLKQARNNDGKTAEEVRNPVHIPLEIRKRGDKSVEAYLNALRSGKSKNNHCNLVVLGEERVGKTSLIKGLLGKDFDPDCKSTQGVQIDQIQTVAESVDIVLPLDSNQPLAEVWVAVEPLKRVKEHYVESVAEAVTDADPKLPEEKIEDYDVATTEEELAIEVEEIIKELQPLEQQRKPQKKRKYPKSPTDSSRPQSKRKPPQSTEIADVHSQSVVSHQDHTQHPQVQSRGGTQTQPQGHEPQHATSPPRESISYSDSKEIGRRLRQKAKHQRNLIFHAIDFAGQSLYRPMHHCFITHRAVYIVVFKLTDILDQIKDKNPLIDPVIHEIRYWLNNIIAHSKVANKLEHPKIFLVGTHKNGDPSGKNTQPLNDKEVEEINEKIVKVFVADVHEDRYCNAIQFISDEGEGHIVFSVENSHTSKHDPNRRESGILKFMKRIEEVKGELTFLNDDFPVSYMRFELKLLQMREERKQHPLSTTRKDVEDWTKDCGIGAEGVDTAIQFFHDIRVIVDQGLVTSPFKQIAEPPEPDCDDLVLLSPQWLGDMMCKVVQLKLGNKDFNMRRMKAFRHSGIMLKSDLQKCLLHDECPLEAHDAKSFNNLLAILESYCLIFRVLKPLYELLHFASDEKEDLFLIPCKMPISSSKSDVLKIAKDCYKFEFDFQSYLPNEVYIHCVCKFLYKIAQATRLKEDRRKVELSDTCSIFCFFKLGESLADWKIEMDHDKHILIFSVFPRDDQYSTNPHMYIVEISELVLEDVCSSGSLGCLAYKGGPRVNCSCSDDCLTLPFVQSVPERTIPTPANGHCDCPKCYRKFDVDDIFKQQVSPADEKLSHDGPVIQNVQTTVNIVSGSSVEISQPEPCKVAGRKQTVVESKSVAEQPQHHLLVKIAEEFCDEAPSLVSDEPVTVSSSTYTIGILNESPSIDDAFDCMREMSHQWDELARGLKIKWDDRQQLQRDQSISSDLKLETVLHKWQEGKACVISWQKLIDVLKKLNRTDIADNIKHFLANKKN